MPSPLLDTNDSAAASYTDVCSKPTLPRLLEQGIQASNLGLVPFRLGRFHLPQQGKEPLVQSDLLGSRLVAVIELPSHGRKLTHVHVRAPDIHFFDDVRPVFVLESVENA
jgi:hypothetical protein